MTKWRVTIELVDDGAAHEYTPLTREQILDQCEPDDLTFGLRLIGITAEEIE